MLTELDSTHFLTTIANQLSILLVDTPETKQTDKIKKKLAHATKDYYYINHNSTFLPFLTVEENLLIGINKKEQAHYLALLADWLKIFRLEEPLIALRAKRVPQESQLLIHLSRALALQRQVIILDEAKLTISDHFIAGLIPILKKLAASEQLTIIILTQSTTLCHNYPELLITLPS